MLPAAARADICAISASCVDWLAIGCVLLVEARLAVGLVEARDAVADHGRVDDVGLRGLDAPDHLRHVDVGHAQRHVHLVEHLAAGLGGTGPR